MLRDEPERAVSDGRRPSLVSCTPAVRLPPGLRVQNLPGEEVVAANEEYVYTGSEPLLPFGLGIKYTDFEDDDPLLSTVELPPAGTVSLTN